MVSRNWLLVELTEAIAADRATGFTCGAADGSVNLGLGHRFALLIWCRHGELIAVLTAEDLFDRRATARLATEEQSGEQDRGAWQRRQVRRGATWHSSRASVTIPQVPVAKGLSHLTCRRSL